MRRFFLQSGMELVVGEYTLAGEDLKFFWGGKGGLRLGFFSQMLFQKDGF